MYKLVSKSEFCEEFEVVYDDKFSWEAREAIYDYLEYENENDSRLGIELNINDIYFRFTEADIVDVINDYEIPCKRYLQPGWYYRNFNNTIKYLGEENCIHKENQDKLVHLSIFLDEGTFIDKYIYTYIRDSNDLKTLEDTFDCTYEGTPVEPKEVLYWLKDRTWAALLNNTIVYEIF